MCKKTSDSLGIVTDSPASIAFLRLLLYQRRCAKMSTLYTTFPMLIHQTRSIERLQQLLLTLLLMLLLMLMQGPRVRSV